MKHANLSLRERAWKRFSKKRPSKKQAQRFLDLKDKHFYLKDTKLWHHDALMRIQNLKISDEAKRITFEDGVSRLLSYRPKTSARELNSFVRILERRESDLSENYFTSPTRSIAHSFFLLLKFSPKLSPERLRFFGKVFDEVHSKPSHYSTHRIFSENGFPRLLKAKKDISIKELQKSWEIARSISEFASPYVLGGIASLFEAKKNLSIGELEICGKIAKSAVGSELDPSGRGEDVYIMDPPILGVEQHHLAQKGEAYAHSVSFPAVSTLISISKLLKQKPNLSLKELATYGMRFVEKARAGLSDVAITESLESLGTGDRKGEIRAVGGAFGAAPKVYRHPHLYRLMPAPAIRAWEKLAAAGVPVEPILDKEVIGSDESSGKKMFPRAREGQVVVKTERVGESLDAVLPRLSRDQGVSVLRQVLNIMKRTWSLGVVHGHMHTGNFTVRFVGGKAEVMLIDFELAYKTDNVYREINKKVQRVFAQRDTPLNVALKTLDTISNFVGRGRGFKEYLLRDLKK